MASTNDTEPHGSKCVVPVVFEKPIISAGAELVPDCPVRFSIGLIVKDSPAKDTTKIHRSDKVQKNSRNLEPF